MKAENLKLDELISFEEGRLHLHERRLVIHDINAFAHLRKDLVEMLGMDNARRILTRFGYFWGAADAAAMKRIFEWDSPLEWLKAGPRMHTIQGVTRVAVKSLKFDPNAPVFEMDVVWHDSGEAEEHRLAFGPAEFPVCWMLTGYASGYASFVMNANVYFIETQCAAKGDYVCTATGRMEADWGDQITPHLPYFKADEMFSRIMQLSEELKQKTRELALRRRELDRAETQAPAMIEVRSESYRKAMELAARVAPFDTSVLITGESGAGKEVMARFIHAQSTRAGQAFVAANCGALPETLLESELFGHAAGAFTGAGRDRAGLIESADKGTVFLDEIAEMTPAMQVKLLRVLQNGEYLRVGDSRPRRADLRVIAATHRDLRAEIASGRFREDLYYRLGVVEIAIPPLRERREDILPLARYFIKRLRRKLNMAALRLDATCLDPLQKHGWPGNVRELENAMERAAVICYDGVIRPEHLPPAILRAAADQEGEPANSARSLEEMEQVHIRRVLESVRGNKARAARVLGISTATLWRKLKQSADPKE